MGVAAVKWLEGLGLLVSASPATKEQDVTVSKKEGSQTECNTMWENTATLKRNLARCAKRRNYVIGSHRNDHITSIQWKNPLFFIVKDQCHPNPCLHDGMCMEVNDELGFLCNCTAGYRGSHCQGTLRDNGIYHTFIYCAFFLVKAQRYLTQTWKGCG